MEEEINQLINATLSKDKLAFGKLYDLSIDDVYMTIHFLMEDKEEVDDVVQETYLQVYKNLKKFDQTKSFKRWITGIAIKQVRSHRRKRWRTLRILKKVEQFEEPPSVRKTDEQLDRVYDDSFIELIKQLSFKQKQVVILHYFHEYSQEEIAQILNIPIGTVKSRIHAALTKLRKQGHEGCHYIRKVGNV